MTNEQIRDNLGKRVKRKGNEYILSAYILRYTDDGRRIKQLELRDLNAKSSVIVVKPDEVEVLENA
jgi:hypothetical protein